MDMGIFCSVHRKAIKQRSQTVCVSQRLVGDTFDEHAQQGAESHAEEHCDEEGDQHPCRIRAFPEQECENEQTGICADHEDVAVCEIDELQYRKPWYSPVL